MQTCQVCGYNNQAGSYICAHCGASFSTAPVIIPPGYYAPVPQRRSVLPTVLITGGIVLFLAVVAFGVLAAIGLHIEAKEKAEAEARRQAEIAAIHQVQERNDTLLTALRTDLNATKPSSDDDFNAMSDRFNTYVATARQIDISACPQDYGDGFGRYLNSISELSQTIREHPHIPSDFESGFNDLLGNFSDEVAQHAAQTKTDLKNWEDQVQAKGDEVTRQRNALKALATSHGA